MEAAVAAGYSCPSWQQDNVVTLAAESGRCSDTDVFTTYLSMEAVQEMAQGMKESDLAMQETVEEMGGEPLPTTTLLVGPNWIINSPDAAELQPELGGSVATW